MHSLPEFRSLKAKIRVLCKQRRLRLEEFMKTFDIHRVKRIKSEQFKRALDVCGLHLSAIEINLLIAKYQIADDPSFVDYQPKPTFQPSHPSDSETVKLDIPKPLTLAEETTLAVVKQKLMTAVMNKGIVLKDVFRDFDRSNAGKVTRSQFVRNISDIVILSPKETNILLEAYGDNLDVRYRALHYDICPGASNADFKVAASLSPDRRRLPSTAAAHHSVGIQELEAELFNVVLRDRIRTKNFFTDFDPLRAGKCTEAQFRRCVKLCFPFLSESDFALLVEKYGIMHSLDTFKVDYVRFCNSIEGKKSSQDNNFDDILDSLPTASTHMGGKCSRKLRASLSDDDKVVYQDMMQRLHTLYTTRRMLLKPSFQDFDKGRREHITVDQFLRVMAMFKLTFKDENEKSVILRRYSSAYGERFINYITFCHDLEHWVDEDDNQRLASRPSSRGGIVSEIIAPSKLCTDTSADTTGITRVRSIAMLMRFIKQTVKRDRIRMDEFFRDFDKLRHGKITLAQFCAGLNSAGLHLSGEEMTMLSNEYAWKEADRAGSHWIAWRTFVNDIESVFTVNGLEKTPIMI
ncbi:putative EF-hand domain-containing protein [Plasmopara halstedii]